MSLKYSNANYYRMNGNGLNRHGHRQIFSSLRTRFLRVIPSNLIFKFNEGKAKIGNLLKRSKTNNNAKFYFYKYIGNR